MGRVAGDDVAAEVHLKFPFSPVAHAASAAVRSRQARDREADEAREKSSGNARFARLSAPSSHRVLAPSFAVYASA